MELLQEGGWRPPAYPVVTAPRDPVSGWWGQQGVIFLDLRYDGARTVTGRIMAGAPHNMAAIAQGTFDRSTAVLHLDGHAKDHRNGRPGTWAIDGMVDDDEAMVSATFNGFAGNFRLTRQGTRLRMSKRSLRSHLGALAFLWRAPMPSIRKAS